LLLKNLIFAFKTLIASKIYKRPNLITFFNDNNKLIRLIFVGDNCSIKVKKIKIRFQNQIYLTVQIILPLDMSEQLR